MDAYITNSKPFITVDEKTGKTVIAFDKHITHMESNSQSYSITCVINDDPSPAELFKHKLKYIE